MYVTEAIGATSFWHLRDWRLLPRGLPRWEKRGWERETGSCARSDRLLAEDWAPDDPKTAANQTRG